MLAKLIILGCFSTLVFSQTTVPSNNLCENGVCMPYYLCFNGSINTGGHGSIDKRSASFESESEQCENVFEICCEISNNNTVPINNEQIEFDTIVAQNDGCGHRNVDGLGLIMKLNDNDALYGEFPWMTAVLEKKVHPITNNQINVYQCGGALIHPKVVLTAAHCVFNKSITTLIIRVGEWDTQRKSEPFPHQDGFIAEILIHEHYNSDVLYNDVALLFLNESVELAENIETICLPPQNFISESTACAVSGWGKNNLGRSGKYQLIMKKIELPIIPKQNCSEALKNTRLGHRFELHDSFICAGGELGKDTCKGDAGSPLVCPIPNTEHRYYLAGSVSWGIGCGESDVPGVYVNIPRFRDWIDKQFLLKELSTSYYIP